MSKTIQYNVKVDTGNSVKTLGQLEEELAQINEELRGVDRNSQAFDDLTKSAHETTAEIEKVNRQIEGIRGEDRIQAVDGSLKVLGGTVQGVVGGLGLLGIESEKFGEFEEKAASAIALGIGLKDVGEGVGQLSKFIAKLPGPTKLATAANKAFNIVLRANPIGLIVTAIGLVVAGFVLFSDKVQDVIKSIKPLNTILEKTVGFFKSVGRAIGLVATEEEEAAQKFTEATNSRIADLDREIKLRAAKGEETVELEREKLQKLIELQEEGSEEQKNAINDLAVFEATIVKQRKDAAIEAEKEKQAELDKLAEEEKAKKIKEDEDEKARLQKIEDERKGRETSAKELAEQERLDAELLNQTQFEQELTLLDREYEEKLAKLDEFNISKEDLDANYLARKKEILDEEAQAQKDLTDYNIALAEEEAFIKQAVVNATIDNVQDSLEQLFGESKAIASANVLIDAGQAAVGILKQSTKGIPAPLAPVFIASQLALLAATTISSLRQINSAEPGKSAGAPSLPRGSSSVPSTPTAAQDGRPQPIEAYVLSGNVTSAQEADSKIRQRRTVGTN
jgi:hypothetical protein